LVALGAGNAASHDAHLLHVIKDVVGWTGDQSRLTAFAVEESVAPTTVLKEKNALKK
jgi:hypothetical protein